MQRRCVVALAVTAGLAVVAAPAHPVWLTTGGGPAPATAATLAAPGGITAGRPTADAVPLTWGAAPALPTGRIAYHVERASTTGGWAPACGTSAGAPITTTSCTDTGLTTATEYRYRVTAQLGRWRRQGSPSGPVTTAAAPAVRV